jgi:hypothetical protein
MRVNTLIIFSFAAFALLGAQPLAAAPAVAVFPMDFVDTSGEPPDPSLRDARLKLATDMLVDTLAKTGRFAPVDLTPYADEIAKMDRRYLCGDCFLAVARKAGASFAVVSVVHKVSTLISSMDIALFDVNTGTFLADLEGQIRGDTDEAYTHGVKFLIRNRLPDAINGEGAAQ